GLDSCKILTASLTLVAFGLGEDPKLANEIIAIIGSIPNILTVLAVICAMVAKSSAGGSILIEVSLKNIGPRRVIIRLVVAIRDAPFAKPMSSNIGFTTDG